MGLMCPGITGPDLALAQVEKLLVETAELALGVGEMDLQNPVAYPPGLVMAAHGRVVARGDVGLDVFAVDLLVRELADQVSAVPVAEGPSSRAGQPGDLGVELRPVGAGGTVEVAPAGGEDDGQFAPQPVLDRVAAEHVGAPQVGFELVED